MNGNQERKKESLGGSLCNLVLQAIMGYYFYIYAYRNLDKTTCFALDDSTDVYGTGSGDMTDVSGQFTLWFKIGFVIQCASMLCSVLGIGYHFTQSQHINAPNQLVGCMACCGGIALFVWGIIIRFGDTGRACSGDFYHGSG